jgi:hypothetical protein
VIHLHVFTVFGLDWVVLIAIGIFLIETIRQGSDDGGIPDPRTKVALPYNILHVAVRSELTNLDGMVLKDRGEVSLYLI